MRSEHSPQPEIEDQFRQILKQDKVVRRKRRNNRESKLAGQSKFANTSLQSDESLSIISQSDLLNEFQKLPEVPNKVNLP